MLKEIKVWRVGGRQRRGRLCGAQVGWTRQKRGGCAARMWSGYRDGRRRSNMQRKPDGAKNGGAWCYAGAGLLRARGEVRRGEIRRSCVRCVGPMRR
ncbi:hypothetical protein U1Q18_046657 [Sarracenia purpurea var. burkii]